MNSENSPVVGMTKSSRRQESFPVGAALVASSVATVAEAAESTGITTTMANMAPDGDLLGLCLLLITAGGLVCLRGHILPP